MSANVQALLREAGIRDNEIAILAEKFDSLCTADQRSGRKMIGIEKFSALLSSLGIPAEHCPHYFRAFNVANNAGIDIDEFLVGVAAMEPDTAHAGSWNEQRSRLIFRLYDQNADGILDLNEFKLMLHHIRLESGAPAPTDADVQEQLKSFSNVTNGQVALTDFLRATATVSFRGCSRLLRLSESLVRQFSDEPKVKVNGKEVSRRAIQMQGNEWIISIEGVQMLKDLELGLRRNHRERLTNEFGGPGIPVKIKMGSKDSFTDSLTLAYKYSCRYPRLNTHPVDISAGLTVIIGPVPTLTGLRSGPLLASQQKVAETGPAEEQGTPKYAAANIAAIEKTLTSGAAAPNFANIQSTGGVRSRRPTSMNVFGASVQKWKLAEHVVELEREEGDVVNVQSIWEMHAINAVTDSALGGIPLPSGLAPALPEHQSQAALPSRLQSQVDRLNPHSQSREQHMLKSLRLFAKGVPSKMASQAGAIPTTRGQRVPFSWGQQSVEWWHDYAKAVMRLCEKARAIFLQEPRMLEIPAPCHVLGDLHGNFGDLMAFEKILWRAGPQLSPSKFLFLGDYVDRGSCGVEVTTYLLAQKILAPEAIYMLRGNHEERDTNSNPNYKPNLLSECVDKFGSDLGRDVWEAMNTCFDAMPIVASVAGSIFCVHGGISKLMMAGIEAVNSIPRDLREPRVQSPLAWDLMWSDPAGSGQNLPSGFGPNTTRGAGCIFTQGALEEFLQQNNFSHVIRAHEMRLAGFQLQLGAKLITVFSSSSYCGNQNKAACVLVHDGKIRFIVLSHADK